MNTSLVQSKEPRPMPLSAERAARPARPSASRAGSAPAARWRTLLAGPLAVGVALAIHFCAARNEPPVDTRTYTLFLGGLLGLFVAAAVVQGWWPGLRRWMTHQCPILAAAVWLLGLWEAITSGLRL